VLADGVINLVVQPEVSSIDPTASVVINNLTIPGLQTRRAKTVVELRDGESFAMAGLIRKDFQDTVRQFRCLGRFRSSAHCPFDRLPERADRVVIIVTPRLVQPVRAGELKAPTDRVGPPTRPTCCSTAGPTPGCRRRRRRSSLQRLRSFYRPPKEWLRRSRWALRRIMAMSSRRVLLASAGCIALCACTTANKQLATKIRPSARL